MSILPVMILVSMLVVVGAGIAFFWAVEHDQFEDLKSPAFLPLQDDAAPDTRAGAPAARESARSVSAGSEPANRQPPAPPRPRASS